MDCKTARLLLDFARPSPCELEAEEAGALQGHLDHCSDCHTLADSERQLDACLGRAMRQVEVPAGLRDQLLVRLEAERGDWQRQRFAQHARLGVAAAALLLLSWFGWNRLKEYRTTPINLEAVSASFNNGVAQDPRLRAEQMLNSLGIETALSPDQVNYNYLVGQPALTELPGHPGRVVPMLLFEQGGRHAIVYLVKDKAIPQDVSPFVGGGTFKAELLPSDGGAYRFLVVHDGDSLDWLRPPKPSAT